MKRTLLTNRMKTWQVFVALTMLVLGAVVAGQNRSAQDAEVRMKAAAQKELRDGDPQGAMELYQKIVDTAGVNPAIAARAQAEIGRLREKLGSGEAIAYRGLTKIPIQNPSNYLRVPPDGRYVYDGTLGFFDVVTREVRKIDGGPRCSLDAVALSTDGKQVACGVNRDVGGAELRIVPRDGDKRTPGALIVRSQDFTRIQPFGWSPDDKHIFVLLVREDHTYGIADISPVNGRIRPLKSLDWRWPRRLSLSPNGRYIAYDVPTARDSVNRDIMLLVADGSSEAVLVAHPARDADPIWTPDGSGVVFTSDRDGTSKLWLAEVADGKGGVVERLMQRESDALSRASLLRPVGFARDGSLFYEKLDADPAGVIQSSEMDSPTGSVLPPKITFGRGVIGSPSYSPDGKVLAYFSARHGRVSTIADLVGPLTLVLRSLESGEEREIPTTVTVTTGPAWMPDGKSIVFSGRLDSDSLLDSIHRIDLRTGADVMVTAAKGGVLAISPDGRSIYSKSRSRDGSLHIVAYDVDTGRDREVLKYDSQQPPDLRYAFSALAASPNGREVIVWYSGSMRVMPTDGGPSRSVDGLPFGPTEGIKFIGWSEDRKNVFVNRRTELWEVSVGGLSARRVGTGLYADASVRPDGKEISFVQRAPAPQSELWVAPDILPSGRNQIFLAEVTPRDTKVRQAPVALSQRPLQRHSSPKWSPDGKSIAFVRGNDLVIRSVATGTERVYPGTGNVESWFHDGKAVLQYRWDQNGSGGSFVKVDVEGGNSIEIGRHASRSVWTALSPDDQTLYLLEPGTALNGGAIVALDLTGQQERRMPLPGRVELLALSSDGRTLATLIRKRDERHYLATVRVDGHDYHELYTDQSMRLVAHLAWTGDNRGILAIRDSKDDDPELIRFPADGGRPALTGFHYPHLNSFDVSPDGSHIVFEGIRPTTAQHSR